MRQGSLYPSSVSVEGLAGTALAGDSTSAVEEEAHRTVVVVLHNRHLEDRSYGSVS
jgi:hypothetical protein